MNEKVYRDYTREALDVAYNARDTVPDFDGLIETWTERSAETRKKLEVVRDVEFGPAEDEKLDLFLAPDGKNAPFHLFIHGGYWRALTKEESSFVAEALVPMGANVVVNSYSLAPAVRIGEIVEQCRRAVICIHDHGSQFGDVGRVYISGHSAGGHLAAMMLATDWTEYGLPADIIKGGTLISGVFDLEPIQKCFVNEWLDLTDEEVAAFSPQRHPPKAKCPVIVTYGDGDPSGFHVQAAEYAEVLKANGNPVTFIEQKGKDHFEAAESLMDQQNEVTRAVAAQMGL